MELSENFRGYPPFKPSSRWNGHNLLRILPLTTAIRSFKPRREERVYITNVTANGPGFPSNAFTIRMSDDSDAATFGFDAYQTALSAGVASEEREKLCHLFESFRFPFSCTTASIKVVYHGFAAIMEGAMGELIHENPVPSFFDGERWVEGDPFERVDEAVAKVRIGNEVQEDVQFVVRSRAFWKTTGEGQEGFVSSENITVPITGLETCWTGHGVRMG